MSCWHHTALPKGICGLRMKTRFILTVQPARLHQIPWQNGQEFSEKASQYVALINYKAAGRRCTVVFDGYAWSSKHHKDKKRTKHCVMIASERNCPLSKDKFVGNERNKESFITYLCELISEYFETTVADDDSDTLIANMAIDLSATSSVELMAEDCDVLVLLKHHGAGSARLYSSQREGKLLHHRYLY